MLLGVPLVVDDIQKLHKRCLSNAPVLHYTDIFEDDIHVLTFLAPCLGLWLELLSSFCKVVPTVPGSLLRKIGGLGLTHCHQFSSCLSTVPTHSLVWQLDF